MAEEEHGKKGGAASWFLKKLFSTPATYLGLAAGLGVVKACLGVEMPMGGAISGGILLGFVVGTLSFLIMHGIRASHRRSIDSGQDPVADPSEQPLIESLRNSGLSEDAELLEKLVADRDAIAKQYVGKTDNADAAHTLELASAIGKEACLQAGELQDLVRRIEDPLLEVPDGAEEEVEGIRELLRRSYRAVADSRSRLRRGEQLKEIDFLADSESLTSLNLASLTKQLEEETAVSRGIEERLQPEYKSRIVMDDPVESAGKDSWESE